VLCYEGEVKALTLKQPWASLILSGAKRVETRSWSTAYRGPLIITASKALSKADHNLCYTEPFRAALALAGFVPHPGGTKGQHMQAKERLPLGCALCVVDLVACLPTQDLKPFLLARELAFGDYTAGRWAWIFTGRVWRIPNEPKVKGALSLWTPPAALAAEADRVMRP